MTIHNTFFLSFLASSSSSLVKLGVWDDSLSDDSDSDAYNYCNTKYVIYNLQFWSLPFHFVNKIIVFVFFPMFKGSLGCMNILLVDVGWNIIMNILLVDVGWNIIGQIWKLQSSVSISLLWIILMSNLHARRFSTFYIFESNYFHENEY